jgi:hypothetical protein
MDILSALGLFASRLKANPRVSDFRAGAAAATLAAAPQYFSSISASLIFSIS